MPAPSELVVATKAVDRLRKEKMFYKVELVKQKERVRKLEEEIKAEGENKDANADFVLRQESLAVDETIAVFGPLKQRTEDAVARLEEMIATSESSGVAPADELEKAREALQAAQESLARSDADDEAIAA